MNISPYEATMLACFGISWPISVAKALRTKIVTGKSPIFLLLVIIGYAAGVIHKVLHKNDWVIWLYVFNGVMVSLDLVLYLMYRKNR